MVVPISQVTPGSYLEKMVWREIVIARGFFTCGKLCHEALAIRVMRRGVTHPTILYTFSCLQIVGVAKEHVLNDGMGRTLQARV